MMPALVNEAAPVLPPAYHRAQSLIGPFLHIDAMTDASPRHPVSSGRTPGASLMLTPAACRSWRSTSNVQ
jgi:hypothetical protein